MKRILFLHNTLMPYRIPFFNMIGEIYSVRFVFTRMKIASDMYGLDQSSLFKDFKSNNFKIIDDPFRILKIVKEVMTSDFDIMVDSLEYVAPLTFLIAKIRHKPIMFWSEIWKEHPGSRRKILALFCIRFIANHSDGLIIPGTKHKEFFMSLGCSPENLFIVPNVNILPTDEIPLDQEIFENKKVILYVGRLLQCKGIDFLIEAFAMLRRDRNDAILVIVGDGEHEEALKNLSRRLNIVDDIHFIGYVEPKKLHFFYSQADICVFPSISDYGASVEIECWGFVVNEAMQFGKPVVVTDIVGAGYDMVKDGVNGFIVPEMNSYALYNSIKIILSDPDLQKEMGANSKAIVDHGFKYENMVYGFKRAIDSFISSK